MPETLIYKLTADVCVVTEIDLRPFEGDCSAFLKYNLFLSSLIFRFSIPFYIHVMF